MSYYFPSSSNTSFSINRTTLHSKGQRNTFVSDLNSVKIKTLNHFLSSLLLCTIEVR